MSGSGPAESSDLAPGTAPGDRRRSLSQGEDSKAPDEPLHNEEDAIAKSPSDLLLGPQVAGSSAKSDRLLTEVAELLKRPATDKLRPTHEEIVPDSTIERWLTELGLDSAAQADSQLVVEGGELGALAIPEEESQPSSSSQPKGSLPAPATARIGGSQTTGGAAASGAPVRAASVGNASAAKTPPGLTHVPSFATISGKPYAATPSRSRLRLFWLLMCLLVLAVVIWIFQPDLAIWLSKSLIAARLPDQVTKFVPPMALGTPWF